MTASDQQTVRSIFPLPLTAFEEVMLADDRADFPMCFFIEIGLLGSLSQECFESAFRESIKRHPLLNANVVRSGFRQFWVESSIFPQPEYCSGNTQSGNVQQQAVELPGIDLKQQPGIRVLVGRNAEGAQIVFQFHHAATDGMGALQFIGDLLAHYGLLTAAGDAQRPIPAVIDPLALTHRGQLWAAGHRPPNLVRRFLWRVWQVLSVHPSSLHGMSSPDQQEASRSASRRLFTTRTLDHQTAARLRTHANRSGCSLNDLIACCLFKTLREWQKHSEIDPDDNILRIGLPASTRTPLHDRIPAANVLSYILLTRRSRELDHDKSLLNYVSSETLEVTRSGDTGLVLLSMRIGCLIPGLMSLVTRIPRTICTAILANVGDVRRQLKAQFPIHEGRCVAGNVRLEYLLGAAPVRPGTHVASSFGKYAGRLYVNLNFATRIFTEAEQDEIADLFLKNITETAQSDSWSSDLSTSSPLTSSSPVNNHWGSIRQHSPLRFWFRFLLFPALALLLFPPFLMALPDASTLSLTLWIAGLTYCWFCVGGMFHEAAHATLFRSPMANQIVGRAIGTIIAIPLTVYRETHRRHHAYLNTPQDYELWPYSDPGCSRNFRRCFVWLDLFLGVLTAPLIYGRIYFLKDRRLRPQTRRDITFEYALVGLFWSTLTIAVLVWSRMSGRPLELRYLLAFLPLTLAATMNTARKFIEHLGLPSDDPLFGTRTIVSGGLLSRLCRYFNFDIATHGPHHRYPRASHEDLAGLMQKHVAADERLQHQTFGSYLAAALDTLPHLWTNPASGSFEKQASSSSAEPNRAPIGDESTN